MTAARAIPGRGPAARRAAAIAVLDTIVDPCSRAFGHPVGLAGMGMIERVSVAGASVSVLLLPTFPDCLFRGHFEAEAERLLLALPWCREVSVAFCPADQSWDESRLGPAAREAFGRPSRRARAGAAVAAAE
jgi:metal-sulfur cluster biosynthetic enzyme